MARATNFNGHFRLAGRRIVSTGTKPSRGRRGLIFLLGGGASVDAGMPAVAGLTKELKRRLPRLRDINGKRRAGLARLFDAVARVDPSILCNHERFFD